ncbi:vezatin isoform X3 [Ambystoma mexicanum]|uniref:vezatin isoform X3 n=1 Tax=Ambystoma mexicanum TaxID=8296 RepID=UPI0037E7F327
MTAEFDEEVVFENSPLYHYLQDLGHTDFEVCQPVPQEVEPCGAEEGPRTKDALGMPMLHILSSLVDTIRSWTPFSLDRQKDETLHKLDVGFRLDSLCTILRQEVLLQEDVELLELLDPGVLSAGQPEPPEARRHLPTLRSLATPNVWDLSVLFAFASSLFALKSWDVSSWLTWGPGLLAFAAFVFLRAVSKWRMAKLQMSLRKYHTQLENTVADSRAFTNLVRKALRLIQETEVISRGFTLLLDRVSAACPFDKAGQHPSQHLIGLRKAVYRSVRANFRLSRLATLYMLKHYPLNSEIDNVTNYICVVPLKDLRLGLSKVQVSEEEAHNLTDGFSLPALKVLFQLWIGQSSEFYRRLALLLSPENECIGPTTPLESLPHCIWSDVAMDLPHTQATCLAELKRSYEFYRYFETQHQSSSDRSTKTKQKMGELHNLHRAVRSLQLHLKALLNEVIILEDDVEKLASSKETPEPASEAYQVLEQKLKVINPHMQASNSCWEEASYQVEKMTRRRPEKKRQLGGTMREFPLYSSTGVHTSLAHRRQRPNTRRTAAMTRLSPAETTEPTSNGAVRLSYDTETQDNDMNIDSHNKQIQDTNHEKSRTEYVSEETMTSRRVDICAQDGVLPEKEKTCYQFEGDEDTSKLGVVEVEASMPSRIDTVQSSVKDRLARLHLLTDFSFTSGLAAQVAARSIAFTFMDEQQTFGDEDEEEELEDFGAEQNGVLTEGSKSEQQSSDNGGTL